MKLVDYSTWLAEWKKLALPGTPHWERIQTQLDPAVAEQFAALQGVAPPAGAVDVGYEQIEMLVSLALSSGARGLVFQSNTPLSASDSGARRRALTLKLINDRLQLVEPWIVGGGYIGEATTSSPATVRAAVLHTERAQLVLPTSWRRDGQYALGSQPFDGGSLIVPGVPETNEAYGLSAAGMRRLSHERVAGGRRILMDDRDVDSMVLLTQDRQAYTYLAQQTEKLAPAASAAQIELASLEYSTAEDLVGRLATLGVPIPAAAESLATAREEIGRGQSLLAAGDPKLSYVAARQAAAELSRLERSAWDEAMRRSSGPVANPLATNVWTTAEALEFESRLRAARSGPNLLPGGDMEDLDQMRVQGWRHVRHALEGVTTAAELTAIAPQAGRSCLRLEVKPTDPEAALRLIPTPPMWFQSAQAAVQAGQVVRIHGWVRIDQRITSSVDGLFIFDSLGGPSLAQRIGATTGWRQFTLFRAAPRSGAVTLTFALTGFGVADIDSVTIEPLELGR